MKKAILISIKPEWVCKILNGEKTIEVRKTAPKCGLPIDVYIYCTQGKYLFAPNGWNEHWWVQKYFSGEGKYNGKVVAKFRLKKVEKLERYAGVYIPETILHTASIQTRSSIEKKSCLSMDEIWKYTNGNGYAWHISDLEILDEPKELSEFYMLQCNQKKRPCNIKDVFGLEECHRICKLCKPLAKPPRSWQFTEIEEE